MERRAILELRAQREHIVGHAIVFDTRSADLGGFVEIVRPSAVDRALAPGADVRALYNHEAGALLGRTPHSLALSKDARGLWFDLNPADTTVGRDTFELVKRGDLTGASFGFRTIKDAWHQDGKLTIRELLDVEIVEISLTAFPGYQQTDVSVAQRAFRTRNGGQSGSHFGQSAVQRSLAWLRLEARLR